MQSREIKALFEIALLVGRAVNLEKTLSNILQVLHETLQMERATIVLLDETGDKLRIKASYGLTEEEEKRGVYEFGEGITGKVFKTSSPFVVPDIKKEPMFLNKTRSRDKFLISKEKISFIGVPIILKSKAVGVLTVDKVFEHKISFEEDIRFLTVLATLVAQFLELHQAIIKREKNLIEENRELKALLHKEKTTTEIIGNSKLMKELYITINKVAPTRATVLLLGESGTGKELIASNIHYLSPRNDKPFIKINCASLPEQLLESELFGHEKGAFTGALNRKKGRFEIADGGTIFLDEIGELPITLQSKLLRVLQEYEFERLGGTETIHVDVRIIAATNRELENAVEKGDFRLDLYHRLNVVPVIIPPLRQRREDIPALIDYFLRKYSDLHKKNLGVSKEVMDDFMRYEWPGNVRELQNLIERLVIMTEGNCIKQSDLPCFVTTHSPCVINPADYSQHPEIPNVSVLIAPTFAAQPENINKAKTLYDIEKEQIEDSLIKYNWNQSKTAKALGLTLRQVGYKIKKFNIIIPEKKIS